MWGLRDPPSRASPLPEELQLQTCSSLQLRAKETEEAFIFVASCRNGNAKNTNSEQVVMHSLVFNTSYRFVEIPRSGNEHPQNQKFQIQNSCRNLDYPHPRIRNCKSIVPDSNPRTPEGPGPGFRIRASPDPNTCIFNPNLLDLIFQITSRGLLPSRTLGMKSFSVLVRFFLVVDSLRSVSAFAYGVISNYAMFLKAYSMCTQI